MMPEALPKVFPAVLNGLGRFRHGRPEDRFRGWLRTMKRNEVGRFCYRRLARPTRLAVPTRHRNCSRPPLTGLSVSSRKEDPALGTLTEWEHPL